MSNKPSGWSLSEVAGRKLEADAAEWSSRNPELVERAKQADHGFVRRVTTEDKVFAGVNALFTGLMLIDGARRLAHSRETDVKTGEAKIAYGSVVMGAIELLLGVGMAAITHDQLRPHSPILSRF